MVVNAFAYAATTAGWVPVSDNWHFVDQIVYPYAHGDLRPQDLLLKRGTLDHSQPLRRLLLLANYEWFGLDFRIEAMFAVLAGAAAFCLLGLGLRREVRAAGWVGWASLAAMASVYFSPSAPMVFTWSLLTLGFSSHLFLFLWLMAAWAVYENPSRWRAMALVLSTFVFGLVADDTAMVAVVAAVMAAALYGWRERAARRAAFMLAGACIAGIVLYVAFYRMAMPATMGVEARAGSTHGVDARGLLAQAGGAWQWIQVPLSSALVHRATIQSWFGAAGGIATLVLGLACMLAHLWFWRKAFTGDCNRSAFIAVSIMLLFYGLVAGIVLGRVSEFGNGYLWQPRYGFIYRWHVIALLAMLIAQSPAMAAKAGGSRLPRGIALASVAFLVALQLPLGVSMWKEAKYVRHANARFARQLLEMGGSAEAMPSGKCAVQLVVCRFGDARRQRVVRFLQRQRLSAFSPEVRARNGYPED